MNAVNIIINEMAEKWLIPSGILHDVYFMMSNAPRFFSGKRPYGIKYQAMSDHLKQHYRINVSERQLRYLVLRVHDKVSK